MYKSQLRNVTPDLRATYWIGRAEEAGFTIDEVDLDVIGGIAVYINKNEKQVWLAIMNSGRDTFVCHSADRKPYGYLNEEGWSLVKNYLEMTEHPAQKWIRDHAVEVSAFSGYRIAVHPEQGIVAFGDSLSDVSSRVRDLYSTDLDKILYLKV